MRTEPDIQARDEGRTREDLARLAKQLAKHGIMSGRARLSRRAYDESAPLIAAVRRSTVMGFPKCPSAPASLAAATCSGRVFAVNMSSGTAD